MKTRLIWCLSFFIVLVLAGFFFWTIREWSEMRQREKEIIKLDKILASFEEDQQKQQHRGKPPPASSDVVSSTESDDLVSDTGHIRTEDTATLAGKGPNKGIAVVPETTIKGTEKETEQNRRKSLFDFGAYPDVPLGLFPHGEKVWDEIETLAEDDSSSARNLELMVRVRIKFWELGTETVGASMSNTGIILPSIPNVAYVTYGTRETEDGETKQYIQRITGGAGLTAVEFDMVEAGVTPSGWTILSHSSGGIDPYSFLEFE